MAPGAVLLAVALWLSAARNAQNSRHRLVAAGLLLAIGCFFTQRQLRPAYDSATLAHLRQVNALAEEIYTRVSIGKIAKPWVAVDYITDCLDAPVLRVICYERHKVWLPLDMTLPTGIAEPDERDVMSRLSRSHFVFLTEQGPPGLFPYDRKLAAMHPQILAWCDANLRGVNRFDLLGRRMLLYQRRDVPFAASAP
jgi:hypothetical protein